MILQRLKRGAASGIGAAFYDLYQDPHEKNLHLVPLIHTQGQFLRMRARHELMKNKYPDKPNAKGIPLTGLSNARPETKAIRDMVRRNIEELPFSLQEYLQHEPPTELRDFDWGQVSVTERHFSQGKVRLAADGLGKSCNVAMALEGRR